MLEAASTGLPVSQKISATCAISMLTNDINGLVQERRNSSALVHWQRSYVFFALTH